MFITCPECSTRYVVKADAIGAEGRKVKCAKCDHKWHQDPPSDDEREVAATAVDTTPQETAEIKTDKRKLPVVTDSKEPIVSKWMKAAVFLLLICNAVGGVIVYKDEITMHMPQAKKFYEMAGLHDAKDGIIMYDISVIEAPWKETTAKWISGVLYNSEEEDIAIQKIRISMLDQEYKKIGERYFPTNDQALAAKEELPFRAPLPRMPEDTAHLVVDMGNDLHMLLY